jgi:hypothetical protein
LKKQQRWPNRKSALTFQTYRLGSQRVRREAKAPAETVEASSQLNSPSIFCSIFSDLSFQEKHIFMC